MIRSTLFLLAACLFGAASASAQELKFSPSAPIRDGEVVEIFVDEKGDIYRELRYHGVVPNQRDDIGRITRTRTKKGKRVSPAVTWVGFQQQRFASRVFIQTTHLTHYTITKPDPSRIVILIDDAKVPARQTRRPLVTSQYATSVSTVRAKNVKGGAQVTIHLSRPAGYLYKQEGRYIFIDVER